MALTIAQTNFVSKVQATARIFADGYGDMTALNALWYGETNDYQSDITDAELAEIPAFVGITHDDINEMMFIVANVLTLMETRLEQIAALTA